MGDSTRRWLGREGTETSRPENSGGILGSSIPLQPVASLVRTLSTSSAVMRLSEIGHAISHAIGTAREFAASLPESHRRQFLDDARALARRRTGPLIDPRQTRSVAVVDDLAIGAILTIVIIILFVLLFLAYLLQLSRDPWVRKQGEELREGLDEKKEKVISWASATEDYTKAKDKAGVIVKSKEEAYNQCFEKNKGLDENSACRKALEKVRQALDSLKYTLSKKPDRFTDGFKPDQLAIGIGRAVATLFLALMDAADKCRGCEDLRPF